MKKWVVKFKDLETIKVLEDMGILSYKPSLHEDLKFVFIKTDMSQEEILNIKGIESCRPEAKGTLFI